MQFGSHSFYQASYQQAYQSVGSLSMVSIEQIKQDNNIDYLQSVCTYIEQMNINPLWFESQQNKDKLKLLQLYQLAITYSKNLSHRYSAQIKRLQEINQKLSSKAEDKVQQVKRQKESFRLKKEQYKKKKHSRYRDIYYKLKKQIKDGEEESQVDEHPTNNPYSPYYSYYPPFPPHYPPPSNYNYPPTPYMQSANQSPGQSIPMNINKNNQGNNFQQQLGANLLEHFSRPNTQQNQTNRRDLKHEIAKNSRNNNLINSKKIDKSFFKIDDESKEDMESSLILNNINMVQSKKPSVSNQNILTQVRKTKKEQKKQNTDDDFDQIENLTAQSKKSINKKQGSNSKKISKEQFQQDSSQRIKKQEIPRPTSVKSSKQSIQQGNNSYEIAQIDSIVGMRLGNPQSKLQKGSQNHHFQSNIIPKGMNHPLSRNLKLNNPGSISPRDQSSSSQDIKIEANSKFSKNTPSQNTKLFNKQPKRSSKNQTNPTGIKQEDSQNINLQSDSMNFNLNLKSNIQNRNKPQNIYTGSSSEQFGRIDDSNIHKKGVKNKQKTDTAQKMNMKHPERRSTLNKIEQQKHNQLKISQANSESLNGSKNKLMHSDAVRINSHQVPYLQPNNQEFDDIKQSSNGLNRQKKLNTSQTVEVYTGSTKPKRASKEETGRQVGKSHLATPPPLKQSLIQQIKQEQQKYQQKFEQDDEMLDIGVQQLQKSHNPYSNRESRPKQFEKMLDVEDFNLQNSHKPKSKKFQQTLKPSQPKQSQKSQVDIQLPSNQSIKQINKYHKLNNEQFKLATKNNTLNIQANALKIEESLQQFDDFIAFMPANSVIAKPSARFLPSKLIKQPKEKSNHPKSLKEISMEQISQASTSKQISINLISPDHQKREKLLTRKQKVLNKKQEQQTQQQNIRQSDMITNVNGVFQSKIVSQGSMSNLLNGLNEKQQILYKPDLITQKKVVQEDQEQYIQDFDSSFQKSSNNGNKKDECRHAIIRMIKESQHLNPIKVSAQIFNQNQLENLIKNVCKINLSDLKASNIKQAQRKLQIQLQRITKQNQRKANKINDIIKAEKNQLNKPNPIQQQQKPKLKSINEGLANDSLNYSHSIVGKQNLQNHSKIAKVQMKLDTDITDSVVFDNPYTPQPNQSRLQEPSKQTHERKSPKSANPFLFENKKQLGTKQQQNLFKNVGQGISKYDKDDPLQRQIANMINKKAKKEQEQDQFDDW